MRKKKYQQPSATAIIILPQGGMMTASNGDLQRSTDDVEEFERGTELRGRRKPDEWDVDADEEEY